MALSAPVGQACTHSPQATQLLSAIASLRSKLICDNAPRCTMPMTSFICVSRQARTQRVHWMQASRLTAIAGWLRSGAGCARANAASAGRALTPSLAAQSLSSPCGRLASPSTQRLP